MSRLVFAQTLYARDQWLHTPSYPPIFPFLGANVQQMFVVDAAGVLLTAISGSTITMIVDLSPYLGRSTLISNAYFGLSENTGLDRGPFTRILGVPHVISVNGKVGQAVQQNLMDLVSGGEYVARFMVRLSDASVQSYVAPFTALGGVGNYLLDDSDPPHILLDDDGVPLTVG